MKLGSIVIMEALASQDWAGAIQELADYFHIEIPTCTPRVDSHRLATCMWIYGDAKIYEWDAIHGFDVIPTNFSRLPPTKSLPRSPAIWLQTK